MSFIRKIASFVGILCLFLMFLFGFRRLEDCPHIDGVGDVLVLVDEKDEMQ